MGRSEATQRAPARAWGAGTTRPEHGAAVEAEPANLDYLYALADHYARHGDFPRALAVIEQMIETHPEASIGPDMKESIEQALVQGEGN